MAASLIYRRCRTQTRILDYLASTEIPNVGNESDYGSDVSEGENTSEQSEFSDSGEESSGND